jgi:hypothetical protein
MTAAIGELQFSVLLRGNWESFYGSLFFNALYLTFAALGTHLMITYLGRDRRTLWVIIFYMAFSV